MRTDVKVGLVCVLALVVAVITYFALQSKTKEPTQTADNHSANVADHNKDVAPPATPAADPTAVTVSPPAPAVVTPPAAFSQEPTAQVSPSTPASVPAGTPYPPSGPRSLLPPTTPEPAAPPLTREPTPAPATPSLVGPGDNPGEREGPSLHRDSLLDTHTPPTHSLDTPDAPMVPAGSSTYIVVSGDNLTNIAKKNHTTVAALKAANPTINPDKLKIKQPINLPAPGTGVPTTRPAHTAATRPAHTAATRPGHSSTTRPASAAAGTYTVKKGDSLRKIAKSVYGNEKLWRRIFRLNRGELSDPNAITPGMVLKIPAH